MAQVDDDDIVLYGQTMVGCLLARELLHHIICREVHNLKQTTGESIINTL